MNDEKTQQARNFLDQNKFEEALQLVQTLERQEGLTPEEKLTCLILKSQILIKKGEIPQSLEIAEAAFSLSQSVGNPLLKVDTINAKAEALRFMGQFGISHTQTPEYLQMIEQGEQLLDTITDAEPLEVSKRAAYLLRYKGMLYRSLLDFDAAIQCLQKSNELHEEVGNKEEMAQALWSLAKAYGMKNDQDRQLETLWKVKELYKERENKEEVALLLVDIAFVYHAKGQPALALEQAQKSQALAETLPKTVQLGWLFSSIADLYLLERTEWESNFALNQKALAISEEFGDKGGIGKSFARISQYYWVFKGELGIGLEFAEKALAAFEESGVKVLLSWPLNNLGWIAQLKGELDVALGYHEKALGLAEEVGSTQYIAESLWSIARVQQAKGDNNLALSNYQRCLKACEELGWNYFWSTYFAVSIYCQLTILSLDNQAIDEAKTYFQQLKQLKESTKRHSSWTRLNYLLSEAMLLKRSTRIRDKAKAQAIFHQMIDDEETFSWFKVPAMLNLCELLLFELRASSDEIAEEDPVLQEVKTLISDISSLAKDMPSYSLLVEILILQSKFTLIEGDLSAAAHYLDQARITAEEKELQVHAQKVAEEQHLLENQFDTWQELIQSNASFQTRLEQARFADYLQEAMKVAHIGQIRSGGS